MQSSRSSGILFACKFVLLLSTYLVPALSVEKGELKRENVEKHHFPFLLFLDGQQTSSKVPEFVAAIDTDNQISYTNREYLSVTIDSGEILHNWSPFNFSSKKLQQLGAGLAPTILRVGGTSQDVITFDPDGEVDERAILLNEKLLKRQSAKWLDASDNRYPTGKVAPYILNFNLTGSQWKLMSDYARKVGWGIIFGFNLLTRKDGQWDPTNAIGFLKYSAAIGSPLTGFQLGNEPDRYKFEFNTSFSGKQLVQDFKILQSVLRDTAPYVSSKLCGPDIGIFSTGLLKAFLDSGAYEVVQEIDLHHYYLNGRTAKAAQLIDPSVLDTLHKELKAAVDLTQGSPPALPFRLSETSSCYDSGAANISDRYLAGFMWLDKLGMSATYGATAVFRQSFFGQNYSLLSKKTLDPNPDYFLSVLFKRLVEGSVFQVGTGPADHHLRVYSHCARRDYYNYPPGAVVVYYLNLFDNSVTLSLPQYKGMMFNLFQLTSGDEHTLLSEYVKLNGERLVMSGSDLPPMDPVLHQGNVLVPAYSMGFLVVPNADVELCK